MPVVSPVHCPRELSPKERAALKRLMRNKRYDCNHREADRRYPILRRAFVPASYQKSAPTVVLLCAITKPAKDGTFEYAVFVDGLFGNGHWPTDKYGAGTMTDALASFEEHAVFELFGYWPWVMRKHMREVHKFVRSSRKERQGERHGAQSVRKATHARSAARAPQVRGGKRRR
jgi:hypothetical protein